MNMPRLDIQQTFAKLDWEVQTPSYTFEPGRAELSIQQQPAEMVLHRTPSQLTIDQSQCWADMDLKHTFRRIAEDAAAGHQQALAYIEKVTLEGEQLGAIEHGGNTIRSLAMDNRFLPEHSFTYGNVPSNFSLRLDFTPGDLGMEWNTGGTTIDVHTAPFQHHYEKGKITYMMQKKNEMHFQMVGGNVNAGY
ncbi:DUF6470 family protein [Aneurinibacillus sp. REN35]|uniref:DUF6470 family protein n=1 Tax=Aneurinibacillus sp. REN35 TaxID=3237286 RepID=UPI003528E338